MQKFLRFLFIIHFGLNFAIAQSNNADKSKITGFWINDKKDIIIHIYEDSKGLFHGKVVWLLDSLDEYGTPRRDVMNNDARLRSRKLIGINILSDYKFDRNDREWDDGRIYNFDNGNTYRGKMWIHEDGTLRVRGHWWILWFLSRTKTWTRTSPPEWSESVARKK
ncbi:MAG: DUF2147 domain-containing protein [Chitinophagales bacterium]|nr:DUF2147 domain-containing protein [Chitinophagales bacterium]MDW8273461.1 DUF2147 domain-containing protein [Chitinophagales bacterium]